MNNSAIFLVGIFLLLKASLFAQVSVGVEGGLSNNTYHTNISNRASTELAAVKGFAADVLLRRGVRPWLYITAAPGVGQKGYSMNRTDSLYGEYDEHRNLYIVLPVGVSIAYEWRRFRGTVDPGLFGGYWMSGRQKGSIANLFSVTDNGSASGSSSEQFLL